MDYIICPECRGTVELDSKKSRCNRGHEFQVVGGVTDFLGNTSDERILEEETHWDTVADMGSNTIMPDPYITSKIVDNLRLLYERVITHIWPNCNRRSVSIGEIGCGSGSAMSYLDKVEFAAVKYFGADVSIKRLLMGINRKPPDNWIAHFMRTSANKPLFNDNSLDIIFSAAALHHLDVRAAIELISCSIKPGGLLILNEPTLNNPFARVGRKMIKGFHTKGEKALVPKVIKQVAAENKLELVYEKGMQFFTGPLEYLLGIIKPPKPVVVCSYYLGRSIDSLIRSISLNYTFIQIFQKVPSN